MRTQTSNPFGRSRQLRRGGALVTVMCLAAAMLATSAVVLMMSHRSAFFAAKLKKDASALIDAESGISVMLDIMGSSRTEYNKWAALGTNRTLVTNYNNSALTIVTSSTHDSTTGVRTTRISSTAVAGEEDRNTIMEASWVPFYFYQIVSDGNIEVDSSAPEIWGDVHANSNCLNKSGNPVIHGTLTCSGSTCEFTGTDGTSSNEPPVVMDRPLSTPGQHYDCRMSFPDWENMARFGSPTGFYYSASKTFSGETLRPPNGVVYVNGSITMSRKTTVYGVVVAKDDVTISQSFDMFAPSNAVPAWWTNYYGTAYGNSWPCLLAGGNIYEKNRNDFAYPGCFFAAGTIELHNQRTFAGSLVSLTKVYIKNRATISNQGFALTNTVDLTMGAWIK